MGYGVRYSSFWPLRTNFWTKFGQFRWFLDLSDQNELHHTPSYPKIWDLSKEKQFLNYPFNLPSLPDRFGKISSEENSVWKYALYPVISGYRLESQANLFICWAIQRDSRRTSLPACSVMSTNRTWFQTHNVEEENTSLFGPNNLTMVIHLVDFLHSVFLN